MTADAPDFQRVVVLNDDPSDLMPGPDAPDFQVTAQLVNSPENDVPDWQRYIVGPGGTPISTGYGWEAAVVADIGAFAGNWYLLAEIFGSSDQVVDCIAGNGAAISGAGYTPGHAGIIPGSPFGSAKFTGASYAFYEPGSSSGYSLTNPYWMFAVFQTAPAASGPLGILGLWDTFGGSGTRASMYLNGSGYMVAGQDKAGGPFYPVTGAVDLIDGKSHLAIVTWDGSSTLEAYVDGVSIGTSSPPTIPTDLVFPWIAYATAGVAGAGTIWNFDGFLQSCGVFSKKTLTAAEVTTLWKASKIA